MALCDRIPSHLLPMLDLTQPALGILSATWYPISLTYPMMDRALEQYGGEGRELAAAINRDLVPKMIQGIYRMIFRSASTASHAASSSPRYARRLQSRTWPGP